MIPLREVKLCIKNAWNPASIVNRQKTTTFWTDSASKNGNLHKNGNGEKREKVKDAA
jgi:hypothetical protein